MPKNQAAVNVIISQYLYPMMNKYHIKLQSDPPILYFCAMICRCVVTAVSSAQKSPQSGFCVGQNTKKWLENTTALMLLYAKCSHVQQTKGKFVRMQFEQWYLHQGRPNNLLYFISPVSFGFPSKTKNYHIVVTAGQPFKVHRRCLDIIQNV